MNGINLTTNPTLEACAPDACSTPYEFVRLRYFFGQRLGVLELTDEQAYVVGKQRFHNQRLHGAGVVCGLRVERYLPASAELTTLLRVSSGAAIDACGREILVGWDSCIDVAAWHRKYRSTNPDLADFTGESPRARRLWVAVCYRECPSDPAAAPRDPCGCESTGCENSRIREGFELRLLTESELPQRPAPALPSAPCPQSSEACLVLARVDLELREGEVVNLHEPDNEPAERLELWSTAMIQAALTAVLDGGSLPGALGGPRLGSLEFTGTDQTSGTLHLPVLLAAGPDGSPSALIGDPTGGIAFVTRALDPNGNWQTLDPVVSWDEANSRYDLSFTGTLAEARYRVHAAVSQEEPVVDAAFRELSPRTFDRWFHLELAGGILTLSTTP